MATNFSQVPVGSIFNAGGIKFRKSDDLYYEDLQTGYQAMWNPLFDETIVNQGATQESKAEVNVTDKFLVDAQTRLIKINPNYQDHPPCLAENTFSDMWRTAEYDCSPLEYHYMAAVSVSAVRSMKDLGNVVGLDGSSSNFFPAIVDILTKAYKQVNQPQKSSVKKLTKKSVLAKKAKKKVKR